MSAIDRLHSINVAEFGLLQAAICIPIFFAIDAVGVAIFHECCTFLSVVGEFYLGLAVSFFDFFRKDILLVFAGVHFYSMLIRMESLRFEKWQMAYFDGRCSKKPTKNRSVQVLYPLILVTAVLTAYVTMDEWTFLGAAFVFLFIVAVVLHGQNFFRKVYHWWLVRKKARLTKRHEEFMAELSALERGWFEKIDQEELEGYKNKVKEESDEVEAELHWLARNGV